MRFVFLCIQIYSGKGYQQTNAYNKDVDTFFDSYKNNFLNQRRCKNFHKRLDTSNSAEILREGWSWKARIPRGFTLSIWKQMYHSRFGRGLGTTARFRGIALPHSMTPNFSIPRNAPKSSNYKVSLNHL